MIKYLLIAEFEHKGYVLKFIDCPIEAEDLIIVAHEENSKDTEEYFMEFVKEGFIATYPINGNSKNIGKTKWSTRDYYNSLSAVEINTETFCLKSFIKERENHSEVLEHVNCDDLTGLYELFPSVAIIAN